MYSRRGVGVGEVVDDSIHQRGRPADEDVRVVESDAIEMCRCEVSCIGISVGPAGVPQAHIDVRVRGCERIEFCGVRDAVGRPCVMDERDGTTVR